MKRSSSSSSFPKIPDSSTPISTSPSPLQLHSLSFALPAPSSSLPVPDPWPVSVNSPHLDVKDSDVESDETLWDLYERWMTHCKVSRSLDEKQKRFIAFKENVKFIQLENKTENYPYELKLNVYSDMTNDEFESKHTAAKSVNSFNFKHLDIKDSDLQSDKTLQRLYKLWMTRYRVSRSPNEKLKRFAVFKEQVNYIHSENKKDNMYKLGLNRFSDMTKEELESLEMGVSPSQMLDMYNKIMEMGGLLSKDDYSQGKMDGPRVNIDGYGIAPPNDEEALEEAVNKQPVCVFIDARGDAFKNYRRGVLTEEVGKEPVFTVPLSGYGFTPCGVKYWEIQNCWGPIWGEGGYMRIKKGVNLLGIASFPTFPVMNKPSAAADSKQG